MYASFNDHEGVVRLLLARGARQEQLAHDGRTALHCAAMLGFAATSSILCDAPGGDATLSLARKDGRTPLDVAERGGHSDCAAMLRARGAKRGEDPGGGAGAGGGAAGGAAGDGAASDAAAGAAGDGAAGNCACV